MKDLCELDPLLGLAYTLNEIQCRWAEGYAYVRQKSSKTCQKDWRGDLDRPREPSNLPT